MTQKTGVTNRSRRNDMTRACRNLMESFSEPNLGTRSKNLDARMLVSGVTIKDRSSKDTIVNYIHDPIFLANRNLSSLNWKTQMNVTAF